jgi:hypothetical protein
MDELDRQLLTRSNVVRQQQPVAHGVQHWSEVAGPGKIGIRKLWKDVMGKEKSGMVESHLAVGCEIPDISMAKALQGITKRWNRVHRMCLDRP